MQERDSCQNCGLDFAYDFSNTVGGQDEFQCIFCGHTIFEALDSQP